MKRCKDNTSGESCAAKTAAPGMVPVLSRPRPFSYAEERLEVEVGATVADLVKHAIEERDRDAAHVTIAGHYIPREHWDRVRPNAGAPVLINVMPRGGGDKNPLGVVLMLAATVAAPYIAGPISAAAGFSTMTASHGLIVWSGIGHSLVTGLVGAVSNLLVSALAPPPEPNGAGAADPADRPTLFINGARNQFNPFGVVPCVLGRHRMVPPLAARWYTETVGEDQYIRILLNWGYGPGELSDLRIGETSITEFEDYEIEHRLDGSTDDLALFPVPVYQENMDVGLTQSGGWVTRTTQTNTDEIVVDVTCKRGLVKFNPSGKKKEQTVQIEAQYAPTGTTDWTAGEDSYLTVSSDTIAYSAADLPRQSPYVGDNDYRHRKRRDAIVIDRGTGEASRIEGESQPFFDQNGVAHASATDPVLPGIPDTKILIAEVEVVTKISGNGGVIAVNDKRDPALIGEEIEDSGDFVASESPADTIAITAGGLKHLGIIITAKTTSAIREELRFAVPNGQYDVRLRRLTDDTSDDKIFNETHWTALRSITHQTPVTLPVCLTAIRMRANDQINGNLDQVNGVFEHVVADWDADSETWIERSTSNPASIYRYILQGDANARPLTDDEIDLDNLAYWHEFCDEKGLEFNDIIDNQRSVRRMLDTVAATGRARPAIIEGKRGVVIDEVKTTPIQLLNPRNITQFGWSKNFPEIPHAFRVRYFDRDTGWQDSEIIVYADGYDEETATLFEGLNLPGVTSAEQAWKHARYHLATLLLRPETYTATMGIENIECTKGDLVHLQHWKLLSGILPARVKSVETSGGLVTTITFDEEFYIDTEETYAIRIRYNDGTQKLVAVTGSGYTKTLTVDEDLAEADAPAADDLVSFGASDNVTIPCIIKEIEYSRDLEARLTLVPHAPEIHLADQGEIPSFVRVTTIPPEMVRPPKPVIDTIQTGEEVLRVNTDGSYSARIVIVKAPVADQDITRTTVQIRPTGSGTWRPAEAIVTGNVVTIDDVDEGESYDVRLRHRIDGRVAMSQWTTRTGITVTGEGGNPDDVTGFSVQVLGDVALFSWDQNDDVDLAGYQIKHSSATTGATWSNSSELENLIAKPQKTYQTANRGGTYLIKAVDRSGNVSDSAATVVIDPADTLNLVATLTEDPDFTGTKTDTRVVSNVLKLDEDVTYGIYEFSDVIDLGAVFPVILSIAHDASGEDVGLTVDDWVNVDAIENWDGSADPEKWSVTAQVATTEDDPNDSPTWSDWQNLTQAEFTARGIKYRLILQSEDASITPAISELSATADMPDRIEGGQGVTGDASDDPGTQVQFGKAYFHDDPSVVVTPKGMATGDYFNVLSQDRGGFYVAFYNSAGTRVTRDFDWHAKGYGLQDAIAPVFYQDETIAAVDEMSVAPTLERKILINTLIGDLKDAGVWDKLDALYVLAAHDEQAARVNLVNPGTDTLTNVNSMDFTEDEGFQGDGSTSYLSMTTNLDSLTNFDTDDLHLAVWVGSHYDANTREDLGVAGTDTVRLNSAAGNRYAQAQINSTGATTANSHIPLSSVGHTLAQRTASNAVALYRNAEEIDTDSDGSTTLPSSPLLIGRADTEYSDRMIQVVHIGASLSAGEISDLYDALSAYMAAVALHADTEAYIAEMATPPTTSRAIEYDQMIRALQGEHDILPNMDLFYLFGAANEDAAKINIANPGTDTLTAVNSPTFDADEGYTGDGGTAYLITVSDQDELANGADDDMSAGVFSLSDVTGTTEYDMGLESGSNALRLNSRYGGVGALINIGADGWIADGEADSLGHVLATTTGDDAQEIYRDGVSGGTDTETSLAPVEQKITILAHRPGVVGGCTRQIMAAHYGAALTANEAAMLADMLNWWKTTVLGL